MLILDGTYVRHQKSSNNEYQRRSYSGQKKVPLCKPFTICTTNGLIVDFAGPYAAKYNDAVIVKDVFKNAELRALLKPNDVLVVDRGFRNAVAFLNGLGYIVKMPAILESGQSQLPTEKANESRRVTKVRWVVEACHGVVFGKFKLLKHTLDNKMLTKARQLCRIAGYLHNIYGKRVWTEDDAGAGILEHMESRMSLRNTLADEVETNRWNRRPTLLQKISTTEVTDFPRLSESDLLLLTSGSYQLREAASYLAEILDPDDRAELSFVRTTPTIIRLNIRSRHRSNTEYRVYVEYEPYDDSDVNSIKRYCCDCKNGLRTVGCCAHVATVLYYLSHARFQAVIHRPAHQLTGLFEPSASESESEEEDSGPASLPGPSSSTA